jgi:ferredoxin
MGKYIVQHDRQNCIGCGACTAICSNFWEMGVDGKSVLKGSRQKGNSTELEIEEKDFVCNNNAAQSCPVGVIHITDKEKNKKLI